MKFVVIGLGLFGRALAIQLTHFGHEVTVIDKSADLISSIKDNVAIPLVGDPREMKFFQTYDLPKDCTVIVNIGESFEDNLQIIDNLQKKGVTNIYSRPINKMHSRMLKLLGVQIVQPELMGAEQLALKFDNQSFLTRVAIDDTHALAELPVPEQWVGKTLRDVMIRARYKLNLLTIRRKSNTKVDNKLENDENVLNMPNTPVVDFPEPDMEFQSGDILILFGTEKALAVFAQDFQK